MPERTTAPAAGAQDLGDFTTTSRVLPVSALALLIGVVAAFVAAGLLRLIGLFTNLFFFQRIETTLVSPAANHLGLFVILVPVIGALIIGVMARYGSERIRGHGIPEAIEAILIHGSRVEPKVAVLKPLSSAISIGSGGPFGAEGPIIMTGGAFGSLVAQFFHLTSAERKTLLVAGAVSGMSATFAAPVASVLLGVELLLFEWKPRSVIPVALASVAAAVVRCISRRPRRDACAMHAPRQVAVSRGLGPLNTTVSSVRGRDVAGIGVRAGPIAAMRLRPGVFVARLGVHHRQPSRSRAVRSALPPIEPCCTLIR